MRASAGVLGLAAALSGSATSAQVALGIRASPQGKDPTAMQVFEAVAA